MSNEVSNGQFSHRGRQYKLFRLKPNGDYYIKIQKDGVRKQRSLKTPMLPDARKAAKELIDEILLSKTGWSPAIPATTLHRVFQKYRHIGSAHGLSPRTVEQNISEVRKVVGREIDPKTVSLSLLTGRTVRDFFDREFAKIDVGDEVARQKKLRSIRSSLRQARSVFKEDGVKRYRDAGMEIPDLSEFRKEKVARPQDAPHLQVEDGVFENIETAAGKLPQSRAHIRICHLLAKTTLRRGEVQRAEWKWIVQLDGQPVFRLNANQKGKRPTDIPIDPDIYRELCEWQKEGHDFQYVLPPNGWYKERCGYTCKEYDRWLRECGLNTEHTFHEVRAWSLHKIRERYGMEVAQRIGRHTNPATTQNHYTGLKNIPRDFKLA